MVEVPGEATARRGEVADEALLQGWPVPQTLYASAALAALMGGVQTGFIFALRVRPIPSALRLSPSAAKSSPVFDQHQESQARGLHWPTTLMAVLSAALLAAGVLRHYWDIYRERTVRGISFIFVGIDAAGDLFSLVSVFFQPTLDTLGMVIYGTELVLWLGVFACGGYFNFAPWVRSRRSGRRSAAGSGRGAGSAADSRSVRDSGSSGRREPGRASSDSPVVGEASGEPSAAVRASGALHRASSSTSVFRTASTSLHEEDLDGTEMGSSLGVRAS